MNGTEGFGDWIARVVMEADLGNLTRIKFMLVMECPKVLFTCLRSDS